MLNQEMYVHCPQIQLYMENTVNGKIYENDTTGHTWWLFLADKIVTGMASLSRLGGDITHHQFSEQVGEYLLIPDHP